MKKRMYHAMPKKGEADGIQQISEGKSMMKKENIDRLLSLRLIDDDFFTKVFDDLPPHTRDFSRE